MPIPPNFNDLARQQRLATNSRLSFNSVVNSGSPASQSMAAPTITPTPTPTVTPTPTPTPTLTPTPTPVPDFVVFELAGTNISFQNFGWFISLDSSTGYITTSSTDAFNATVRNQSYTTNNRYRDYIQFGDNYTTGWGQTHTIRVTATSTDSSGQAAGYITRLNPAGFFQATSNQSNNLSSINTTHCSNLQDITLDGGNTGSSIILPVFAINSNTLRTISVSNYMPLQQLVVTNCASLGTILLYDTPHLASVKATGCNNLNTFEGNNVSKLSAVDLTGAAGLQSLVLTNPTYLSAYDTSMINNLTSCNLQFDGGTDDTTAYTRKTSAFCTGTSLTDLEMTGLNLTNVDNLFPSNNLNLLNISYGSTCKDITISNKSQLSAFYIFSNAALSAINISNCPALYDVDVTYNNLNSTKLNAIYSALPDRTGRDTGNIYVVSNPGTNASNAALATVKNWTVVKT